MQQLFRSGLTLQGLVGTARSLVSSVFACLLAKLISTHTIRSRTHENLFFLARNLKFFTTHDSRKHSFDLNTKSSVHLLSLYRSFVRSCHTSPSRSCPHRFVTNTSDDAGSESQQTCRNELFCQYPGHTDRCDCQSSRAAFSTYSLAKVSAAFCQQ